MIAAARLALSELRRHWPLVLVMALAVSVSLFGFLSLHGYRAGIAAEYVTGRSGYLVVQQSSTLGEVKGSQLPAETAAVLAQLGVSQAIAEIHTITGTSFQDSTLIRGVDLARYPAVEPFTLVAGRALHTGDGPRLVMVGRRLADLRRVGSGDTLRLRGRDFTVVGVFQVGTYVDNEAWIALADAQALLGWEGQVSLFVIPDEGILKEGDELPGGLTVLRQGTSAELLARQWEPLLHLMLQVAAALGIGAAIAQGNMLWRLAWMRRHDLAILRTLGFGWQVLTGYLLFQAFVVTGLAFAIGLLGTTALSAWPGLGRNGLRFQLLLNSQVILQSGLLALLIMLAGAALPAWWLGRLNLAALLRADA
jgi:putative ABC transport system permease protein